MNYRHSSLNLIARQYNEKWRFPDYDCAIKKLKCHHVHSFLACNPQNVEGVIHDYDVPVYSCKFSPSKVNSNILAVANENGTVCLENTSKKKFRAFVQTHNNTVFDLAWMPGEKQFVTVSGDHSAKLWDCGESDIKMVSEFLGHTRSVKCVYFKPENTSVFATGSRDGSLILWDARCSRKCSKLPVSHTPDQIIPSAAGTSPYFPKRKYYPVEASQSNSVTALIFQNDNTLISSGSSDQCIRVWDMRKTYSRSVSLPVPKYQLIAPSAGFSHMCIDPAGNKIYANCMDSYVYCFNVNSYHPDPISAFYGHHNGSFYVKSSLSHDGLYLLSGSSDKFAYIWNTRNAELSEVAVKPIFALPGHTAEVASVVMSLAGDMKIATCSDDGTYRLWYPYHSESKELDTTVEGADVFDCDNISSIRTEWKNKRKRSVSDECQPHTSTSSAQKRHLDEDDEENRRIAKRRSQLEMLEYTPPRSSEMKTANILLINDLKSPKKSCAPVKISLKRKLSDLPNFQDDNGCKRKSHERILLPINDPKSNQCENELQVVGVINELRDAEFVDMISAQFSQGKDGDETDSEEFCEKIEFSSPTTNLPNYVKDGTSPYLHRCPKTQKENMDWLTKLRKNAVKNVEATRSDDRETSPKIHTSKGEGKLQPLGVKRKMARSNSTESRNQTLHKYFKISSRATEINCMSQENQKKTY